MNNDGIYPVEEVMGAGVTLFANVFSRKAERRMLGAVLRSFASGKYWKTVCEARAYLRDGDQEMYKACKAMLPVVAFGGVFEGGHSKGHLVRYNHIVVIDIDHLEGAALPTAVGQLREDEYVFAYWLSPSGEGLKGLVRISGDDGGRVDEYQTFARTEHGGGRRFSENVNVGNGGAVESCKREFAVVVGKDKFSQTAQRL